MRALAIAAAGAVALCACWTAAPPLPTPEPEPPPRHSEPAPEVRARELVQAQIDANQMSESHADGGDEARDRQFRDTFAPDAIVSGPQPGDLATELSTTLLANTEIAQLSAGGTDDAIWFVATFRDTAYDGARSPTSPLGYPPNVYVGVATRDRGWKIVAASMTYAVFTDDDVRGKVELPGPPMPDATPATALTQLVLDGPALAKALAPDAIVVRGTTPPQRGPGGLAHWANRTLALHGGTRELIGTRYGIVQVHAAVMPRPGGATGTLDILALATRPHAGAAWTPIFVQYLVD